MDLIANWFWFLIMLKLRKKLKQDSWHCFSFCFHCIFVCVRLRVLIVRTGSFGARATFRATPDATSRDRPWFRTCRTFKSFLSRFGFECSTFWRNRFCCSSLHRIELNQCDIDCTGCHLNNKHNRSKTTWAINTLHPKRIGRTIAFNTFCWMKAMFTSHRSWTGRRLPPLLLPFHMVVRPKSLNIRPAQRPPLCWTQIMRFNMWTIWSVTKILLRPVRRRPAQPALRPRHRFWNRKLVNYRTVDFPTHRRSTCRTTRLYRYRAQITSRTTQTVRFDA